MTTQIYYSPAGNPEVWATGAQPDGYMTADDYLATMPPPPPPAPLTEEEINARRRTEIQTLLDEIDRKSARPLRAVVTGTATDDDRTTLAEFETQAVGLRAELAVLTATRLP